jgi:hypothetical protein
VKYQRPREACSLCGSDERPVKRGTCEDCRPRPRTRQTLSTGEAKLRSWGDVEGQLGLFGDEA